jgi:hypothetical protein
MLAVTPLTPEQQAVVDAECAVYPWWRRVLIALDQFINVAVFGGLIGETISAHAGRLAVRNVWWAVWLCDALDLLESDHGAKACCGDLYRALLVVQAEESSGNLLSMAIGRATRKI